ncbi:MAG: hypothetical protein AAGJ35_03850 [Myxococcota bacterium]
MEKKENAEEAHFCIQQALRIFPLHEKALQTLNQCSNTATLNEIEGKL